MVVKQVYKGKYGKSRYAGLICTIEDSCYDIPCGGAVDGAIIDWLLTPGVENIGRDDILVETVIILKSRGVTVSRRARRNQRPRHGCSTPVRHARGQHQRIQRRSRSHHDRGQHWRSPQPMVGRQREKHIWRSPQPAQGVGRYLGEQLTRSQRYSRGHHEARLRWRARGYQSQALPEDVIGDEAAEWIGTAVLFRIVKGLLRRRGSPREWLFRKPCGKCGPSPCKISCPW